MPHAQCLFLLDSQALFLFPFQDYGKGNMENTHAAMPCQHYSMTEGGNRTISLLTGKSCHSLAERHHGFPPKTGRALFAAFHTDYRQQKAAQAI